MDGRSGSEAYSPDAGRPEDNQERKAESEPSIREMLGELLNRFHPDIDGLHKNLEEQYEANEKTKEIIAAYKQARQGEEKPLRDLYRRYILEEEEEIKERAADLKPHLERLQARFREYLLTEDGDELQAFIEQWEKEWQALSINDQEQFKIVADIHRSLLNLRAQLQEYADFKLFDAGEREKYAESLLEMLGEKMGEVMEQFERGEEALDPAAITGALLSFTQQVAVQIKLMTDEMKPAAGAAPEKEEEKTADDDDDDDDYQEETAASTAVRPATALPPLEEAEEEKDLWPLILAAGAYGLTRTEAGKDAVVPQDNRHRDHLNELKQNNFIKGEWRGAVFMVEDQVLPWCVAPRDLFLLTNLRHYGLFPGSFRHLERPGTDEYFPEAAFLDTTGRALTEYVHGRWEEYLRSPEYQAYLKEFGFDEEERVPVVATE